jgi:hypothetical protein
MDSFKQYLKADAKNRPLKPRAISSYASYLRRVPDILNIKEEVFLKISSSNKLRALLEDLTSSDKFKRVEKGSQGNILTAFRRYIDSVENLEKVEVRTKEFLRELNEAFTKYSKRSADKRKAIDRLILNLDSLLRQDVSTKVRTPIWNYAGLKNKSQVKLTHKVFMHLQKGNYQGMVAMEPAATAKVLAIQAHMELVEKLKGHLHGC